MKKIILISLGLLISWSILAQDVRFSQPYSAPLKVNPAIMGSDNSINAKLNYRSQWAGIDKGYQTASLTFFMPVYEQSNDNNLTAGLFTMNDKAGAFNHLEILAAVAYNIKLTDNGHYLSASIYGGFNQKFMDIKNLTFDDQYVVGSYAPANPSSETVMYESKMFADAGLGLLWYYQPENGNISAFAGFSAFHLTAPNESFIEGDGLLYTKISTQAGIKITPEGSQMSFMPNIIATSQNGVYELATGLHADYSINDEYLVRIGTWYRAHNTIAFLVGFQYTNYYIGYSYDLPSSGISNLATGANTHEISLGYYFNNSENIRKLF
ncbi:MAG: PorP/SprF family type IX secretion system membrane protein [Bacteroidales bacterium]|nr:PorP/SprF family type IX secretion system membrane protein [Bacteroidales bacterium]MDD4216414.1 PorP/SprF family type IX secretion system membrane protein [Bacteroidales bacterium]